MNIDLEKQYVALVRILIADTVISNIVDFSILLNKRK